MVYGVFSLFIPSIIGVRILNYFNKDLKIKDIIFDYITLLLFSFIINVIIMYNGFGIEKDIFKAFDSNIMLFVWIALISLAINIALALLGVTVQKNIQFKIDVESKTNERKGNKNNEDSVKPIKKNRKTSSKTTKKDKNK